MILHFDFKLPRIIPISLIERVAIAPATTLQVQKLQEAIEKVPIEKIYEFPVWKPKIS